MSSLREEFERRLQELPQPPFFARLRDPRQHLSAIQLIRLQYLGISRAFTVAEVQLDRCFEQPGIWVKAVPSAKFAHVRTVSGPVAAIDTVIHQYEFQHPPTAELWLNLDWCDVVDGPLGFINFLKPN